VELLSKQRRSAVEKENQDRLRHAQEMRQIVLEGELLSNAITQTLVEPNGFNAAQDVIFQKRSQELDLLEQEHRQLLLIAKAKNTESEETRQLTRELTSLQNQRLALFAQRVSDINSGTDNPALQQILQQAAIREQMADLERRVIESATKLAAFDTVNNALNVDASDGTLKLEREQLEKDVKDAQKAITDFSKVVAGAEPTLRNGLRRFVDILIGPGAKVAWDKANTNLEKLAVGANIAANVLANLQGLINTFRAGQQEGGTIGGVGSVISALSSSKAIAGIPVIGQFLPAIGGILTFIGGMFKGAAKKIADDVKKSFSRTMEAYQNGNATLVETVNELERQRSQAIIRLSGKKGGKDELKDILPEFDREIQQLKLRQTEITADFEDSLSVLRQQSDVLADVNRQWQGLNDRVKEYLGAGGDAAKAAEFLALSLADLQQQASNELEEAERDAIQEVIKLNDLLKQRQQLVDDFKQKEFDLVNADSIERRQAGSVTRGREVDRLRKEHQETLNNMDEQIRLTTVRVDKEREIFNLSNNIADVRRRDEELSLKALEAYIAKLKDLKAIAGGMVFGSTGGQTVSNNFNVEITVHGVDENTGRNLADAFTAEVYRKMRTVPA
jgi:hypothetical protein